MVCLPNFWLTIDISSYLVDEVWREEDVSQAREAEGRLGEVGEEEDVVVDEGVAEAEGSRGELRGDCWLGFGVVSEGR